MQKPFEEDEWTDALFEIYQEAQAAGREIINFSEVDDRVAEKKAACLGCRGKSIAHTCGKRK